MDRLVVGDVGYGKTEVALRAAFKAIQDGKQVAVLVPDDRPRRPALRTFAQRFAAFPITVRLLSRFVPPHEQDATIAGLAAGSVDLVIGTHRLLSKDVEFRDLGLRRRRRGAALRGRGQGAPQAAPARGGRADAVGDPDPAHAQPGARRCPRPVASSRRRPRTACRSRPGSRRRPPASSATRSCASSTAAARSSSSTTGSRRSRPRPTSCAGCCPGARIVVGHGQMAEGRLEQVMLTFAGGAGGRPGLHDDHRVGARHPEREHDRHRPRRHARPGAALPAPRPRRAELAGAPTPTCSTAAATGCPTRRASGSRRSSTRPSWAPASRSRCPTSRSAAPATSWAASSRGTWPRSASTSTPGCWPRPSRSTRRPGEGRGAAAGARRRDVDLPSTPICPDDYVADEAQKLELYRRLARARTPGDLAAFRQEVIDRFGPLAAARRPAGRGRRAAPRRRGRRDRLDLAREEGQLVVRFGSGLSRGEAMRLIAGAPLPGVRPGDVTFAASQVRIRIPRDPARAWVLTQAIVTRVAAARAPIGADQASSAPFDPPRNR